MAYHLRSVTASCFEGKRALPCALRSKAVYQPSRQLRASRKAVVVHAQQKTRVVRGKCYVTKDVSFGCNPSSTFSNSANFFGEHVAEHRY